MGDSVLPALFSVFEGETISLGSSHHQEVQHLPQTNFKEFSFKLISNEGFHTGQHAWPCLGEHHFVVTFYHLWVVIVVFLLFI